MRGLIVGKFYPLHAGHQHLIRVALEQVRELVVVVGDHPRETIPAEVRIGWLRELFPTVRVERVVDEWGPDSEAWGRVCVECFGGFDLVFTSEEYGPGFAEALGCRHVAVDPPRQLFPVSGTQVREDPWSFWHFLSPPVRSWFCRRIVLVGAESTGKTTLARRLAEHFETLWVPEYGRRYCEEFIARGEVLEAHRWTSAEFEKIAATQRQWEETARRSGPSFIFCDTDAFATAVWHERYVGHPHPGLLAFNEPPALYLLSGADAPFIQDGLRDGEQQRAWMDARFEALLQERGWKYRRLSGSWEERWEQARKAVNGLLGRS